MCVCERAVHHLQFTQKTQHLNQIAVLNDWPLSAQHSVQSRLPRHEAPRQFCLACDVSLGLSLVPDTPNGQHEEGAKAG